MIPGDSQIIWESWHVRNWGLESTQEKGRRKRIEMISDLKNELQPGIPSVLLKGKSKQCYFLVSHSVKKTVNYSVGESSPLILIHGNHLVPVSGNLGQVKCFGEVNKVKNIFLKTTSSKT